MAIDTGARSHGRAASRIGPTHTSTRAPVSRPARSYQRTISESNGPVTPAHPSTRTSERPAFRANREGPKFYGKAFKRNMRYATSGPYQTHLSPSEESAFHNWADQVQHHTGIEVPTSGKTDYDYRGYFKETGGLIPKGHFTDTYKTPYDTTFSRESKYANKSNPLIWRGNKLVNRNNGRIVIRSTQ